MTGPIDPITGSVLSDAVARLKQRGVQPYGAYVPTRFTQGQLQAVLSRTGATTREELMRFPRSRIPTPLLPALDYLVENPRQFQINRDIAVRNSQAALPAPPNPPAKPAEVVQPFRQTLNLPKEALILTGPELPQFRPPALPPPPQNWRMGWEQLTQNQPIPWQALQQLRPAQPQAQQLLAWLVQPKIQQLLQPLLVQNQQMISVDFLRIFMSLLYHPSLSGGFPTLFYRKPNKKALPLIGQPEPVEDVDGPRALDEHDKAPPVSLTVRFTEEQLMALMHHLGNHHHVTLEEIQAYQPQNFEELQILNVLRRKSVFDTLSGLDGDPGELSEQDIHLAISGETYYFEDDNLSIVFTEEETS
jgi:hypothetical protein